MNNYLLLSEIFPPTTGGSGRWFWEIYRRLHGNSVVMAGQSARNDNIDLGHLEVHRTELSLPSWGIVHWKSFQGYLALARKSSQLVRSRDIHQVHCGKALPEGFVGLMVKQWTGIPYICYVHGEELNVAQQSRELSWMTNKVFQNASLVIANCEHTRDLLVSSWHIPQANICLLNPGVDVDYFQPAPRDLAVRAQLGWRDRPVILSVGRLQKRKGQDQMIRAISAIKQAVPDVLYAIAGEGDERSSLENLIRSLDLSHHVVLHGNLADNELRHAYQQCDLFVLSNRTVDGDFEGFGMVLLEAQACGRPVIAGDSGGTRETLQAGISGIIVNCDRIDELSQTVVELMLNEPKRNMMGDAARLWIESRFSWTQLAQQAQAIFDQVPCQRIRQSTVSVP